MLPYLLMVIASRYPTAYYRQQSGRCELSSNQQFLEKKSDRRGILALGLAGAVGGLAGLAGRPQRTRAHHGELNVAAASESSPAIHGESGGSGPGVEGTSDSGPGVRGLSRSADGVVGQTYKGSFFHS